MVKNILELKIDGFWPKINIGCTHVVGGSSNVSCIDLSTGKIIFLDKGRRPGWISPTEFLYLEDLNDKEAIMWKVDITTLVKSDTLVPRDLAAGNSFYVSLGVWATWRAEGNRLVINEKIVPGQYYEASCRNGYVATVRDGYFVVFKGTSEVYHVPRPDRSNSFNVTESAEICYGYFWDSRVVGINGNYDITVTPWKKETPAIGIGSWYWTGTEYPDGSTAVLGRIGTSKQCIIIKDAPVEETFDVQWKSGKFYIAAYGQKFLRVFAVDEDTPKELVVSNPIPEPFPLPETPMPENLLSLVQKYYDIFKPNGQTEDDPAYGKVLNSVCLEAGNGWGLIGRRSGGIIAPSGDNVDFDGLWHKPSNTLYDVFEGNDHHPGWRQIPFNEISSDNFWSAPVSQSKPEPKPEPVDPKVEPNTDYLVIATILNGIQEQIKDLNRKVSGMDLASIESRLDEISQKVMTTSYAETLHADSIANVRAAGENAKCKVVKYLRG